MTYRFTLVLLLAVFGTDGMLAQEVSDSLATDTTAVDTTLSIPVLPPKRARITETPLDTTVVDSLLTKVTKKADKSHFKPDPIRAMWLALVIPGGGQIYNRKYWKLPIVYGGFLGCAYALTWNNQMLKDYSQAYNDIMDNDPNTKSYENMLPLGYDMTGKEEKFKTIFKNKKDHFRKYRDMSILAFGGVYLISVIDAYVDAELSTFDISRDLSIRFEPAIIDMVGPSLGSGKQKSYGLSCNLRF